jgi:hypothetical protein
MLRRAASLHGYASADTHPTIPSFTFLQPLPVGSPGSRLSSGTYRKMLILCLSGIYVDLGIQLA